MCISTNTEGATPSGANESDAAHAVIIFNYPARLGGDTMTRFRQSDDSEESVVETIRERRPTVTPADCVLVALPVLLIVGWVVGVVSSIALSSAVAAATLPALVTLGYVLFYDPPSDYTG